MKCKSIDARHLSEAWRCLHRRGRVWNSKRHAWHAVPATHLLGCEEEGCMATTWDIMALWEPNVAPQS